MELRKEVENMIKKIIAISISFLSLLFFAVPAFAHVIVYPHQVGIAATQDFIVNVPNEKDNPVVSVRLLLPNGLSSVVPYVASGWTITTKTKDSGNNATLTEIDWNGGSIPVGQAEEFGFQAQVPAKPAILDWKAYQTYSDGTLVSWDVNPVIMENLSDTQQDTLADKENKGEYSTTSVINDLTGQNAMDKQTNFTANAVNGISGTLQLTLSIVALALSLIALREARKSNRQTG